MYTKIVSSNELKNNWDPHEYIHQAKIDKLVAEINKRKQIITDNLCKIKELKNEINKCKIKQSKDRYKS